MTLVEDLRLGQQQIVEIARALSVNCRILIMDEPTSALSATEVEVLFKVIRDLTSRGVSIVYISHHLEEALQITDYAVVLRDGAMTAYAPSAKDIDLEWIVRNMVGENFDLGSPPTGHADRRRRAVDRGRQRRRRLRRRLFGGRSPVARCARRRDRLHLRPDGCRPHRAAGSRRRPRADGRRAGRCWRARTSSGLSIAERIARGLVLVPEDRQRDGLVQTMTVGHNLSLASIGAFAKRPVHCRARASSD